MVYNANSNKNQNYKKQNTWNQNSGGSGQSSINLPVAERLAEDYVQVAEDNMRKIYEDYNQYKRPEGSRITSSKLRNILSMVSDIYNEENLRTEDTLSEKNVARIQMMRVRIVYECGREPDIVKPFVEKTKMLNYLLDIKNDRRKFIRYAHYVEALVAYHRYLGGKN